MRVLWNIYNTEFVHPETIRQLFAGYRKVEGIFPNDEFVNYVENAEPAILRDIGALHRKPPQKL